MFFFQPTLKKEESSTMSAEQKTVPENTEVNGTWINA